MSHRPAGLIMALGLLFGVSPVLCRDLSAADDDRERPVMERFLAVLEKAPRRGTALDRVYGFHVERGELDRLIQSYRDRTAKDPTDGASWLLLGLIETQRGRDASAVEALRKAEGTRPDDPLPAYYLGQALVLVGQPDAAVEAFERALTRRPSRNDLIEIFQALGRVHQRARRDDQALAVWTRLEKIFPDDPRVQEQIAAGLAEESKLEPALTRYEAMARSVRDPYRKVRFRLESADLKVKLGRKADALRDYETLLSGLEPESWLAREVRRKIEDVFNRDDDQAGLVQYYEAWVKRAPEDIDAMSRLGRTLAAQGRSAEARDWLDRALKLAPSNRSLRLALIEQLGKERKFAEAASQYEAMAKLEPNNPDVVRDWGRALLRDGSKAEPDRKQAAAQVWRKLVEARPDDPSAAAMVADLDRQAGLVDEAIALYRKAIELAPGSPQYREYLGEYYHQSKRPADALGTWRGMADGASRTAANLERLGEVLANFGYKSDAIETLTQAIQLDPASYNLRIRQASLMLEARRFDDAEAQLVAAGPLASDDEHRDDVLGKRIGVDESACRLSERIEALKAEVAGAKANDPAAWHRLARYQEAARRPVEAVLAAEKAVGLDPQAITPKVTLGRLYEATSRFGEAAEVARNLAKVDRRARSEHLSKVADLEVRLGRKDAALEAAREVLASSPGNPESLQFYANLCFQLGETDEGLNALRRAVRSNESDVPAITNLAEALAREFRTEEAIELYWKAFEKSNDLDARVGQIARLTDLHLRRNQFDRLTARLERLQGEDGKRREGTLFLSQAYATMGDFGTARKQLENLLEANGRDLALLKQLSKLAEEEGDNPAALKYQQQLHEIAPDGESGRRLANLAIKAGDLEFAESLWSKATDAGTGQDLNRVMGALSSLAENGRTEAVLTTTNRLLRADPTNWELLYREAKTLYSLGRFDEALTRFRAILDLRRDDDEVSVTVKGFRKGPNKSSKLAQPGDSAGPYYRILMALRIKGICGLVGGYNSSIVTPWSPGDFGQARLAAIGHEIARARKLGTEAEWLSKWKSGGARTPVDPRTAWDDFYVALMVSEGKALYEAARDLVRVVGHDSSSDLALLETLTSRAVVSSTVIAATNVVRMSTDAAADTTPPLPPDEVDLVRDACRSLIRNKSASMTPAMVTNATTELRRAGRLAEFDADYATLLESANSPNAIATVGPIAAKRADLAGIRKVAEAFYRLPVASRTGTTTLSQAYIIRTPQGTTLIPEYFMGQGMKAMAGAKQYGEILALVDDAMDAVPSPERVAQRAKAGQSPPTNASARLTYPIFTYADDRTVLGSVDYPTPNRHLDYPAILALRSAFTLMKRDDRSADLIEHLKKKAAEAKDPARERLDRLALGAVLWWAEDREGSLRELTKAVELSTGDIDLKLQMAELRSLRKEPEEALAVLDSIEAVDQEMTRRRELLALRLAVQAVRPERARQAAERLFGLRLDNATQILLAGQMQQLGMLDLADAVLARARRSVGNNTSGLSDLMDQYKRQGNLDAASQIALDILRRSTGQALRVGVTDDPYQRQAIEVLAASGKLKEMIEKVEGQVKNSPRSLTLQQTLAAYYRAAGQLDKLKATNEAILKLRPEDTSLRMQIATQQAQAGDFASAIDHYRAVFQHDPSMLSTYSTAIFNTFQQANRVDELVKLLDQVGLKTFDDVGSIRGLIGTMCKDRRMFDQGMILLGKAFEAYPESGMQFLLTLAPINHFWTRPQAYDYAKKAILPPPTATAVEPWAGIDYAVPAGGFGLDGRITTVTTRLIEVADRRGKLDDLAASIDAAISRHPNWLAGKALLATVRLRQGRSEEGRSAIEKLLPDLDARPQYEIFMFLGQEVRDIPACESLAVMIYERAIKTDRAATYSSLYFRSSPFRHLALLYRKAGRSQDALALARKTEDGFRTTTPSSINAPLNAYRQVASFSGLGTLYLELDDPGDALRIYGELFGSPDDIQSARSYDTRGTLPGVDEYLAPARQGIDRALNGLTASMLPATFESLIRPGDSARPVDLRVVVYPREVDKADVRSLLVGALELASRDPAATSKVKADLDAIVNARPGDFEARVALAESVADRPEDLLKVATDLDRLTSENPLPTTAPNGRARDEASRRLGLWLVARNCWEHDSTWAVGDKLAAKALEAARLQVDNAWAVAMLRELGQRSLDRGDRAGAEARFTGLLALIQQDALAPTPATPAPRPAPTSPRPAPSGRPSSPTARVRVPAVLVGKFRQEAEFAVLAAEAGISELSIQAVRDALKGGPPLSPTGIPNSQSLVRTSVSITSEPPADPTTVLVESKLVEIDAAWTRKKIAPEAAYEALRDVLIPPARPTEVFIYDPTLTRAGRPASTDAPGQPGPVALLLARRAKAVGKLADLRKLAESRGESPTARDAVRRLLAAIDEASKP